MKSALYSTGKAEGQLPAELPTEAALLQQIRSAQIPIRTVCKYQPGEAWDLVGHHRRVYQSLLAGVLPLSCSTPSAGCAASTQCACALILMEIITMYKYSHEIPH